MRKVECAQTTSHTAPMRHVWLIACTLLAAAACAASFTRVRDVVLYNSSPSVPVGFYWRTDEPPELGDYVTVRAADVAPRYAAIRDFADADDRFIKRVAARGGTRVCASPTLVHVGADITLTRRTTDGANRPLPSWSGCRVLAADEVFLVGDTDDSFDSRYWGPVRAQRIEGVWRRLQRWGHGA